MKHLYRNFERNNSIYRNAELPRRSDDSAAKKNREARNRLREKIPAHRSRQEAEKNIQFYYDNIWKIREKLLDPNGIRSSTEMIEMGNELSDLHSGTYLDLWVFVKRKDGLASESDKKWFQGQMRTIQSELDKMWDLLEK